MLTSDFIRDYLIEKTKETPKFSTDGVEMMINSPFVEDTKHHLSINLETGLWQDFKSGNKGNFLQLYSSLEGISYKEAEVRVYLKTFDYKPKNYNHLLLKSSLEYKEKDEDNFLEVKVTSYDSVDKLVQDAWFFFESRKLFTYDSKSPSYYVAFDGLFKNRAIIPYKKGKTIFYFQARSLYPEVKPKYLNPSSKSGGIGSGTVLYPYNEESDILYVCEGPIDAISLQLQGVNATCVHGSKVSEIQASQLKRFKGKIVAAFDNDKAGESAIRSLDEMRRKKLINNIYVCKPEAGFKDWNDMHVKGINLAEYTAKNTYAYDREFYSITKAISSL